MKGETVEHYDLMKLNPITAQLDIINFETPANLKIYIKATSGYENIRKWSDDT